MPPSLRAFLEHLLFPPVRIDDAALAKAMAGKLVVITGASFGIGRATARCLGAVGARLILVGRTAERLDALVAEIEAAGGHATTIVSDLADAAQVEALATRLAGLPVDILISNAGKSIRRPLLQSLDRFHDVTRTIGINYLGPIRLVLALIPGLRTRGGQIVSISAANVLLPPLFHWGAYQASKTAADQWLRCAEPELRAVGVALTTLYLPLVRTRMIEPTPYYADVPAMKADQAALRICRTLLTRQHRWMPWWLGPVSIAAMLLHRPIEWIMARQSAR